MPEPYELPPDTPELLTPGEVAKLFGVDRKTVSRWGQNRWLDFIQTLGGHRRYHRSDVQAALRDGFSPRKGGGA
ncbi:helix-turn-helix domain-containing protein [Nonomuraea sp. 10N515B]|uniref:helix-turn-helix domain-containing protein n=1 Tax=Nonomuraea sp. 10N515B TaxID=3457422 RepID=UPI003FCC80BC